MINNNRPNNDQTYQNTIAKLQEKVKLQELLLIKYRSQSEKQEAEIDSLKIKIDTQSIELNTIKRQSPQNLKETKKLKEDLKKAQQYAVNLNEHVEKESKEKQRLLDAVLKNAKKIQLDWQDVTLENTELLQKVKTLQEKYDEANWRAFKAEDDVRSMSQKLRVANKLLKSNTSSSSSKVSLTSSWRGSQSSKYINDERKLEQSARKVKSHLRRLMSPQPKTAILSTPPSKTLSLSNTKINQHYNINPLRNQIDEFNETTKSIEHLLNNSPTYNKYKNISLDDSVKGIINEEKKDGIVNEVTSPIAHVHSNDYIDEEDHEMTTMISDELL